MSSIIYECFIPTAESSSYQLLLLLLILCVQLQKLKQGVDYTDLELVVGSKSIAAIRERSCPCVRAYAVPRACGLVGAQVLVVRLIKIYKYCAHGDSDRPKLGVV